MGLNSGSLSIYTLVGISSDSETIMPVRNCGDGVTLVRAEKGPGYQAIRESLTLQPFSFIVLQHDC